MNSLSYRSEYISFFYYDWFPVDRYLTLKNKWTCPYQGIYFKNLQTCHNASILQFSHDINVIRRLLFAVHWEKRMAKDAQKITNFIWMIYYGKKHKNKNNVFLHILQPTIDECLLQTVYHYTTEYYIRYILYHRHRNNTNCQTHTLQIFEHSYQIYISYIHYTNLFQNKINNTKYKI